MKKVSKARFVIARLVFYGTAILLIVFAAVFLSLQTRPGRELIKDFVIRAIEQKMPVVCRIESLEGSLLSRFEVRGIELKDLKTDARLISADRIDVSYSIPMLLRRVLWVKHLALEGVSVNLVQAKDGSWNFIIPAPESPSMQMPNKTTASKPSSDFKIEIRQLAISDSDISLVQHTGPYPVSRHLKGLNGEAGLKIGKEISAGIKHFSAFLDSPHVNVKDLTGEIRYDINDHHMHFINTRVKGEKSDFTINGSLNFLDREADWLEMALRADVEAMSLGEFGRAFPIQMPDEDIVSGKLSVSGPLSKMECRADLQMDQCHVVTQGMVIIDESNDVSLDLSGSIGELDLAALPALGLESFPGNLNTDFTIVWQKIGMLNQFGQINLDLTSSVLWGYVIDEATLDVRILEDDFIFENLYLKTTCGKLDGNLRLDGILSSEKDNQILFSADVENFNPESLVRNKQYAGSISGAIRSSIFIPKSFDQEKMTVEAICHIDSSQLMNMDISSGILEASMQNETITVDRFDLETAIGTAAIKGRVSIKDETCRLNAHAMLPDLKQINPFFPDIKDNSGFSGSIKATAELEGRWDDLQITAELNGEQVVLRDVSADSLKADGRWNGNAENFNASANCIMKNIQSNGLKFPLLDFESTITPASIRAAIEVQGGQSESLKISGNINRWMEPEKEILIDKMTLVSFDQPPLINPLPVKLMISSDRILVDSLCLDSGTASVVLKGEARFNPPSDVSATLTLNDFNLNRISGFWAPGGKIQGRLSSDVHLSGFLDKPIIHMTASVKEASYDGLPVTDLSFALNYEDSIFDLTGSGIMGGRTVMDIRGSASMDMALYPFRFRPRTETLIAALKLDRFDISGVSEFMLGTDQIKGNLSSDIEISGEPGKPSIAIDASIKEAMFGKFSFSNAAAVITYSDSEAQISASVYRQNKKLLDLEGSALMDLSLYPFELNAKPGGLDLAMDLDHVDISWVSEIINDPEYDISGVLDVAASVSGDLFHPSVQGRMQLIDGELGLKRQDLVYESLKADLRFVEKTITIEDISIGGDKEGVLHLSGVLTHENFKPQTFNIRAEGNQLYIPFHSGVDVRVNPDIILSGAWDAPVLKGKIMVSEGRVNLQRFLEKKLPEIEIIEQEVDENGVLRIPEKEPKPLEFVDPLAADVTVIIPDDLWFRGENEFFEIKGDIQLKKDPHKPFVLFGSVMPVRGTYRFRGKLFQIRQGELIFNGQEQINPVVNIQAETNVDDVTIIIRLTGTFEQINLILDSDPAMAQSDIISYLVFGRAPDDLSEEESFQAGEAALSYTGQIAADKLRDIVGDTLGIDYLSISAGSGGLRQGSLTMGKYVLPKVFVTFRQGFDESATQKVEVTYEINKYFELETQIDNEQTSAVDLIWNYEY